VQWLARDAIVSMGEDDHVEARDAKNDRCAIELRNGCDRLGERKCRWNER